MPTLSSIGTIYGNCSAENPRFDNFREIREPGGFIDNVSDDRVFITIFCSDISGENLARRDPYPEVDHG